MSNDSRTPISPAPVPLIIHMVSRLISVLTPNPTAMSSLPTWLDLGPEPEVSPSTTPSSGPHTSCTCTQLKHSCNFIKFTYCVYACVWGGGEGGARACVRVCVFARECEHECYKLYFVYIMTFTSLHFWQILMACVVLHVISPICLQTIEV